MFNGHLLFLFSMGGLLAVLVYVYLAWFKLVTVFEYDKRNPYRRWCRRCGQEQHQFAWEDFARGYWEAVNPIHDPNCHCHKYA